MHLYQTMAYKRINGNELQKIKKELCSTMEPEHMHRSIQEGDFCIQDDNFCIYLEPRHIQESKI